MQTLATVSFVLIPFDNAHVTIWKKLRVFEEMQTNFVSLLN